MTNYISIQRIADDLAEHPMLRDVSLDRIVNYVLQLIRAVGCPKLYENKVTPIEIKNHRGVLPCDFVEITQVRGLNCQEYVGATDNFLESHGCCDSAKGLPSYRIQGNVIITSEECAPIEISYKSIAVDENGFPMIPESMLTAALAYIKYRRFEILFDMGKVSAQSLTNADKEYCWAVGQATGDLNMPTEDEMQTLTNIWHNLIIRRSEHRNGFATMHNPELIRKH